MLTPENEVIDNMITFTLTNAVKFITSEGISRAFTCLEPSVVKYNPETFELYFAISFEDFPLDERVYSILEVQEKYNEYLDSIETLNKVAK